ncbi:hypothetical protein [Rhizobium sp. TRM95796]|uniref:HVO_A0114 family putative DNA-binding protein n=1 Tax=Rhizobium sp. TRM95796 TaxID=2979862 RepID=UPI0021E7A6B3|nr:hypothetical protein [Rhizobium sp. TRM95796]MCV3765627.1 hypothetical protein [Rhizobium sp. TRM95796]
MTKVDVHVAEPFSASRRRILDALARSDAGETVSEFHIVFPDWTTLASVMTPSRLALLRHLHAHPRSNVADLARGLERDDNGVNDDVAALMAAGLIDRDDFGLSATYGEIRASIAL